MDHLQPARQGFVIDPAVDERSIGRLRALVVDDSYTTGARAQAPAAALRLAGLEVGAVLVLGRVIAPRSCPWHAAFWAARGGARVGGPQRRLHRHSAGQDVIARELGHRGVEVHLRLGWFREPDRGSSGSRRARRGSPTPLRAATAEPTGPVHPGLAGLTGRDGEVDQLDSSRQSQGEAIRYCTGSAVRRSIPSRK